MKPIQQWFDEYGESHQNATNKLIHWICVPTIFFSIVALLSEVSLPFLMDFLPEALSPFANLASVVLLVVIVFYIRLSPTMAIGIALFAILCMALVIPLRSLSIPVWGSALILFTAAWIGQFYGHKVEGKKPSFLQDLSFLLIGPAWLMGFIYKKVGIKY